MKLKETIFEVDVMSRKDGNSIECIYSGTDYQQAYDIADEYNKRNNADYDHDKGFDDYHDGTDGTFANFFFCDYTEDVHGIGKLQ